MKYTDWIVINFTVLCGFFLESIVGLYGAFFVSCIWVLSQNKHTSWIFFVVFLFTAYINDLLFFRAFGQSALVYGTIFFVWVGVRVWSRWRVVVYLLLGMFSSYVFVPLRGHLLMSFFVYCTGWIAMKMWTSYAGNRDIMVQ
ncbi:MAG: hypothetical protein HZA34_00525 [Candidatus Pacebacteria bacterium]|nr:hypothetical protein [Candidatus Paceibacterota bacterium]